MYIHTHTLDFSTKVDFDGERFRYFMFLVGIQCIINAVFAKSGKRIEIVVESHTIDSLSLSLSLTHTHTHTHTASMIQRTPVSLKPFRPFAALAFTYVGAMVSSNTALSYISYPTQVN